MSLRAMLWALNDSPAENPTEVAVLCALGDNADEHGRGTCPSKDTIAGRARISVSTVKRTLRELEDRGVIRRGDQEITARWRYRPTVWDLALEQHRDDHFEADDPRPEAPVDNRASQRGQIDPPSAEGGQIEPRGGSAVTHKPSQRTTPTYGDSQVTGPREEAPPIGSPATAPAAPGRPAGWDEFGPLEPKCRDHMGTHHDAPCSGCRVARERFETAEPKRAARRIREESAAAFEADRRAAAEAARVDVAAEAARVRAELRSARDRAPATGATL